MPPQRLKEHQRTRNRHPFFVVRIEEGEGQRSGQERHQVKGEGGADRPAQVVALRRAQAVEQEAPITGA